MYLKNTNIFNWSPCTLHTWGTLDDDDLRVVVEPLGGSVDEMVEVVEAKLLVGPRLQPRLQHTARLAVDRRTRGLNIFFFFKLLEEKKKKRENEMEEKNYIREKKIAKKDTWCETSKNQNQKDNTEQE